MNISKRKICEAKDKKLDIKTKTENHMLRHFSINFQTQVSTQMYWNVSRAAIQNDILQKYLNNKIGNTRNPWIIIFFLRNQRTNYLFLMMKREIYTSCCHVCIYQIKCPTDGPMKKPLVLRNESVFNLSELNGTGDAISINKFNGGLDNR